MRHVPYDDKHTIAWFKLAEFVSRGEKERALGIYKLLVLSIDDPAFAFKLEGDILYSFRDEVAIEKYLKAANIYQKEERFTEAVAVYENLITINPDSQEYLKSLIELYKKLNCIPKVIFNLKRLFLLKIKANEISNSLELLQNLETFSQENFGHLYEQMSFALLQNNQEKQTILKYLQKTVDDYFLTNDKNSLQKFLSKLENTDQKFYKEIIKNIKE